MLKRIFQQLTTLKKKKKLMAKVTPKWGYIGHDHKN